MERVYWALTGPTASGKTSALIRQASTRPMVAISADSRQVYQHMSIGTGKPTTEEATSLSHKVIDVISPLDRFNAHQFLVLATQELEAALDCGQQPWVVGGTGLYIRALVENLKLGAPPRPRLRAALKHILEGRNPQEVASMFGVSTIDNSNSVRVVRAIENACENLDDAKSVYSTAKLDIAACLDDAEVDDREHLEARARLSNWKCGGIVVIDPGKPALLEKITIRVNGMFASGLVDEVQRLCDLGFGEAGVVKTGIGYREAGQVLDGLMNLQEAIERTIIRTRQYAKRQRTYFKNMGWEIIHPDDFELWSKKKARTVKA